MSKNWYILLDGIKVPVSEEVYRTYKRAEWREEKQDTVRKERESSLDFMSEHGFDGQAVADQELVEGNKYCTQEIIKEELLEELFVNTLNKLLENRDKVLNKVERSVKEAMLR